MITPGSNILVTGATGFVGSYVVRDLIDRGYRVTALRRRKTVPAYIAAHIFNDVHWIEGDILDPAAVEEAMQDADAVVHSAALVSFGAPLAALLEANTQGTANVVNAAIEKQVARFIHVSSVAALGRNDSLHVTEKQIWQPGPRNTNYAVSKHAAEMEVWRAIAEGLNAVIVNPSTILGYGDWNSSSNALFKNAYRQFPWYTNGSNGFVDVQDVSAAIVALMETNISGERFILNSENWTYRRLLDALADGFGKRRPHRLATPMLAGIAWRLERIKSWISGQRPLITRESAKVAQSRTEYDNGKILSALPDFSFRPLEKTIAEACKNYLAHLAV